MQVKLQQHIWVDRHNSYYTNHNTETFIYTSQYSCLRSLYKAMQHFQQEHHYLMQH